MPSRQFPTTASSSLPSSNRGVANAPPGPSFQPCRLTAARTARATQAASSHDSGSKAPPCSICAEVRSAVSPRTTRPPPKLYPATPSARARVRRNGRVSASAASLSASAFFLRETANRSASKSARSSPG